MEESSILIIIIIVIIIVVVVENPLTHLDISAQILGSKHLFQSFPP